MGAAYGIMGLMFCCLFCCTCYGSYKIVFDDEDQEKDQDQDQEKDQEKDQDQDQGFFAGLFETGSTVELGESPGFVTPQA